MKVHGDPSLFDRGTNQSCDAGAEELAEAAIGKTVVAVAMEESGGGGNAIALGLSDGTRLIFEGWGHDWWGTDVVIVSPAKASE